MFLLQFLLLLWSSSVSTNRLVFQKDKDGSQSKMVHFYFSKKDAEDLVDRVCETSLPRRQH